MSIKLMSMVWELQSLTQPRKMLLLSIADHASDEGLAWPAVKTLMRKCSLRSDSGTRRAINELVELGWLTKIERPSKERKGKHQQDTNMYQLNLAKLYAEGNIQPAQYAGSKKPVQPVRGEGSPHDGSQGEGSHGDPAQNSQKTPSEPVPGTADPSVKTDPPLNPSCPVAEQPDEPEADTFLALHPEAAVFSAKKRQWGSVEDLRCAEWIWGRIIRMYEQAAESDGEISRPKEPSWASWANEIRLMCTIDSRTHRQICELYGLVNRDAFWCKNVLSPSKLREKWDELTLKLRANPQSGAVTGGHWNSAEAWENTL
ncbi:helix-turn-helix domain-containing protein [Serratia fonticola]|uniref:helix-turn-helix domain-containing protein n=1 Tax=Serratia fonticola TaxID=47917 RepID=UPI000BA2A7C6|nr:helix-turn-helix domain-containing protein [Serratia fonticola]PAA97746.1 hypothetical protein CJJ13_08965 [Serratia fonticola]